MRNRLQYLYSIFILFGVLLSSYWMLEKRSLTSPMVRRQAARTMQIEASLAPSGLTRLLELEDQFKSMDAGAQNTILPKYNRLPSKQSLLKQKK